MQARKIWLLALLLSLGSTGFANKLNKKTTFTIRLQEQGPPHFIHTDLGLGYSLESDTNGQSPILFLTIYDLNHPNQPVRFKILIDRRPSVLIPRTNYQLSELRRYWQIKQNTGQLYLPYPSLNLRGSTTHFLQTTAEHVNGLTAKGGFSHEISFSSQLSPPGSSLPNHPMFYQASNNNWFTPYIAIPMLNPQFLGLFANIYHDNQGEMKDYSISLTGQLQIAMLQTQLAQAHLQHGLPLLQFFSYQVQNHLPLMVALNNPNVGSIPPSSNDEYTVAYTGHQTITTWADIGKVMSVMISALAIAITFSHYY